MSARVFYCVQAFSRSGRGLIARPTRQVRTADEAHELARRLSERVAAVVAFKVEGDPQAGVWSDPVRIASYGSVAAPR